MLQVSEMFVQMILFNRLLVPFFESGDHPFSNQRIQKAIEKKRPVKQVCQYIISRNGMCWKTKYIKHGRKKIRQECDF